MKRLLLATAAAMLATGTAGAADLRAPVYKAPEAIPALYDWTGFYLGVNAGFGVGRNPSQLTLPGLSDSSFSLAPTGALGGVQAGYNYQFGHWVLGLEADIQASGLKDDGTCVLSCAPGVQAAGFDQTLSWFGTVRARIGRSQGPVLAYATGGFAFGGVRTEVAETFAPGVTGLFSFRDTMTGWTLGSGVEAALGGNWTGKIEYLYVDLGGFNGSYVLGGVPHNLSGDVRSHIFRGGLNYRFGGTTLAAAYPAADWSGFYAGLNVGTGTARNESSLSAPAITQESFMLTPRGFLGGGQIGFNWQAANWLVGLEADFQGSALKNDQTCLIACQAGAFSRFEQSLPWFGTLRGRLGYAAGPALLYVTGGLAYGKIETDIVETFGGLTGAFSFSDTRTGWTVGGGIERPFDLFGLLPPNNWTAKTEYLYVDLGKTTHSYVLGAPHTFTTDTTTHIFRTGLNYHFGGGPVAGRY